MGDLHPEIVSISPSQTGILIVTELGLTGGPVTPLAPPPRAARCLWLWHCKKYREPNHPAQTLIGATTPICKRQYFKGSLGGNSVETRENVDLG